MEDKEEKFKIGSSDDMLANAEKNSEKVLSLKYLEKKLNDFIKEINGNFDILERKIETIKNSLNK